LQTLRVQKAKSSLLHPAFDNIQTFELDDKPFGSGAYGAVFFCHSANGKPLPTPQVVKILIDDGSGSAKTGIRTIRNLQDKIISHNATLKANNLKSIEQINCLYAVPQVSYEGTFQGKTVTGYSQNRLDTSRFVLFKDFFDEPDPQQKKQLRDRFQKTPIADRLQLAYDLAEGFQVLRDMAYIHADINPKNLFISLSPPTLTLIDYDSGVVVNDVKDQADTFGQMGGWIAPEIQAQLLHNRSGRIKVDLNTDTWAVMVGVHYLLFLFHPLDFLKVRGEKTMQTYFSQKRWPEFDKNDPNFRQELLPVYEKYRQLLTQIPAQVVKAFNATINEGYFNPGKRVTYRQWMKVLTEKAQPILQSAEIQSFYADKIQVNAGEKVNLNWQTRHTAKLTLNGQLLKEAKGSREILITADTVFILQATGNDGKILSNQLIIKVLANNASPVSPLPPIQIMPNVVAPSVATVQVGQTAVWEEKNLGSERIGLLLTATLAGVIAFSTQTAPLVLAGLVAAALSALLFFFNGRYQSFRQVEEKNNLRKQAEAQERAYRQTLATLKKMEAEVQNAGSGQQKQKQQLEAQIAALQTKQQQDEATLRQQMQLSMQPLQAQIQALQDQETEEIRRETEKLYQKVINRELPRYLVMDANIEGFQLLFKGALTLNGIFTAADFLDVDKKGNILKTNGDWVNLTALTANKVNKLGEWRQSVIQDIRRRFPQALPPEQKQQIRQKYTAQIQQLNQQQTDLQQKLASGLQQIGLQYSQQTGQWQSQLFSLAGQLNLDLQNRLLQEQQKVQQIRQEAENLKTGIKNYRNISFGNYLGRVLWLIE
jgi:serine/threonine protein kinase